MILLDLIGFSNLDKKKREEERRTVLGKQILDEYKGGGIRGERAWTRARKGKEKAARGWRRFIPRREVSYSLGKRGKDYRASRGTGSYLVVDGCRRWARSGWWMVVARASPSRCRSSRCALGACATFTWLHNPCTRARARGELGKWENHNLRLHHRLEPCVSVS